MQLIQSRSWTMGVKSRSVETLLCFCRLTGIQTWCSGRVKRIWWVHLSWNQSDLNLIKVHIQLTSWVWVIFLRFTLNEPVHKSLNLLFCWGTFWQTSCTDEKQSLKTATEVPPETCSCRFRPYITLKLFRKSARICIVLTLYKTATVWSGLHQQTFDQQKWLYCWCQFLSYCLLIVFNKGSIGTNYMVLRLGIDNALCLMMCEKLWLCVCLRGGGSRFSSFLSVWRHSCGCICFPPAL